MFTRYTARGENHFVDLSSVQMFKHHMSLLGVFQAFLCIPTLYTTKTACGAQPRLKNMSTASHPWIIIGAGKPNLLHMMTHSIQFTQRIFLHTGKQAQLKHACNGVGVRSTYLNRKIEI